MWGESFCRTSFDPFGSKPCGDVMATGRKSFLENFNLGSILWRRENFGSRDGARNRLRRCQSYNKKRFVVKDRWGSRFILKMISILEPIFTFHFPSRRSIASYPRRKVHYAFFPQEGLVWCRKRGEMIAGDTGRYSRRRATLIIAHDTKLYGMHNSIIAWRCTHERTARPPSKSTTRPCSVRSEKSILERRYSLRHPNLWGPHTMLRSVERASKSHVSSEPRSSLHSNTKLHSGAISIHRARVSG